MSKDNGSERAKALAEAVAHIEKQFGRGAIMRLGEASARMGVEATSTGSLALDMALGVGGIPRGRVTEVFGAEASGKSTLAQHIVAEAQKKGELAVYIDAEHALDPEYGRRCGMNVDELLISQPDSGEQALEIADALVRSRAVGVVVIDSVAALVPEAELQGQMGDAHVGRQARLMSQALRKLTSSISRSRAAVVFLNQLRDRIGVAYGDPTVTPGGRALKFHSTVRIKLNRLESIKVGTQPVGCRVKARVVKNKVAPPFREAEFDIMYGRGIDREGDILDLGVARGVVKKSGAFFSFGELKVGHGREAAKDFLREHQDIAAQIEQQIGASPHAPAVSGDGHDEDEEALMATAEQFRPSRAANGSPQEDWNEDI